MNIVGVDYGTKGAIAFINTTDETVQIIDMPMCDGDVDIVSLHQSLEKLPAIDAIWVEDVQAAAPVASKKSLLKQGRNIGMAEAIILLFANNNSIPFNPVNPQRWKRFQGLWGKDKEGSCNVAVRKYPKARDIVFKPYGNRTTTKDLDKIPRYTDFAQPQRTVNMDGRAEALLVADYGRHHG